MTLFSILQNGDPNGSSLNTRPNTAIIHIHKNSEVNENQTQEINEQN